MLAYACESVILTIMHYQKATVTKKDDKKKITPLQRIIYLFIYLFIY